MEKTEEKKSERIRWRSYPCDIEFSFIEYYLAYYLAALFCKTHIKIIHKLMERHSSFHTFILISEKNSLIMDFYQRL